MKVDNPFNAVILDIVNNKTDDLSECDRSSEGLEFDCEQKEFCEREYFYKPYLLNFTSYEYTINPGHINLELRNAIDDLTSEMYAFEVFESMKSSADHVGVFQDAISVNSESFYSNMRITDSVLTQVVAGTGDFFFHEIIASRMTSDVMGELYTSVYCYDHYESFYSTMIMSDDCLLTSTTSVLTYEYQERFYSNIRNVTGELGPPPPKG
jgi:hypothetical protein